MQASSILSTPRIMGAWNACPARPNPMRPTRTMVFSFLNNRLMISAVLETADELQSRPDIGHGAHFHIDQTCAQADVAHDVLIQIRGDAGALLWPTHPQHSSGSQLLADPSEFPGQLCFRLREH